MSSTNKDRGFFVCILDCVDTGCNSADDLWLCDEEESLVFDDGCT